MEKERDMKEKCEGEGKGRRRRGVKEKEGEENVYRGSSHQSTAGCPPQSPVAANAFSLQEREGTHSH